jgi:transposase InsO family protein
MQITPSLLHHSDRGSQYASYAYQALLDTNHFHPNMNRTGTRNDNAVAESFFAPPSRPNAFMTNLTVLAPRQGTTSFSISKRSTTVAIIIPLWAY